MNGERYYIDRLEEQMLLKGQYPLNRYVDPT